MCSNCYEKLYFLPVSPPHHLSPCFVENFNCAVAYEEPIKSLIHELKYAGVIDIGKFCGRLLYYTQKVPEVDVITAVPLHKKRYTERGFNQAEVIAKELSLLSHKAYSQLLTRNVYHTNQASLTNDQERLQNIANNFSFIAGSPPTAVLIIDDVITTGATINECARVLKDHGVKQVFGLSVAHGH